ncbi:MAG: lysylphosphatidylglycerol synthase domain-containing protein, partial [Solirubrobacteraceae bacterium]
SATATPNELPGSVAAPRADRPANSSPEQRSLQRPAAPGPAAPIERNDVRRRLLSVVVLAMCLGAVVLAVPDLRPVVREMEHINPAVVIAAVVLELASCLSFVVIFRLFFEPIPAPAAREMAWAQMGSGALLPGGGAGSLAVGGWLLHLAGMPTRQILRRSSGLFFLTSAINVIVLAAGGLILLVGIGGGPHDVLRTGLPIAVAVAAVIVVLGLPRVMHRVWGRLPAPAWLEDIGTGIPAARDALVRPNWRLLGALGYLLCDIAVLWTTLAAVGPAPPVAALAVAYLAGYLPNVVPIPGGIGILDAGLVGALGLYGLPLSHAAAAVLVYHAVAFWVPTLGGMLAYTRLRPRLAPS